MQPDRDEQPQSLVEIRARVTPEVAAFFKKAAESNLRYQSIEVGQHLEALVGVLSQMEDFEQGLLLRLAQRPGIVRMLRDALIGQWRAIRELPAREPAEPRRQPR